MILSTEQRERLAELVQARSGIAGHLLQEGDVERLAATIERLPEPPTSVLDVGCGTGVLADVLRELGYEASGVDPDESAMTAMVAPHLVGSIDAIPAEDQSVDVVVANEVLEHLPVMVYRSGLAELTRVARHRVVVTVPNSESLESASTRCPECGCIYSIHGHVRRFDRSDMFELVPGFVLSRLDVVGPYKLRHRSLEWWGRRRLLGWWPAQPGATCPQCGHRQHGARTAGDPRRSPLRRVIRVAAAFPWRRWWLVAQYDRDLHRSTSSPVDHQHRDQ